MAWIFLLGPLVILSCIHHKQLLYLQACVPFLAIAGAAGVEAWVGRGWRRAALVLVAVSLAVEAYGVRFLARSSMAAVKVARARAAQPGLRRVALSQTWAYGDRLYLGNAVEIVDLPVSPSREDLRSASGADAVALYLVDLEREPELERTLTDLGFERNATTRWGRSKAVVLVRPVAR